MSDDRLYDPLAPGNQGYSAIPVTPATALASTPIAAPPAPSTAPYVPQEPGKAYAPWADQAEGRQSQVIGDGQPYIPVMGAKGTPPAAVATTQSEPTPQVDKPPLDPRPYAWVAENDPALKEVIDKASELTGVSPERIAWHGFTESKLNPNAPRGKAGEIGMMQILPSTAAGVSLNGKLDPHDTADNVMMSALLMKDLDGRWGKDSLLSVAHYNGSGPRAIAYGKSAFPTGQFNDDTLAKMAQGGSMTPRGLVEAGVQGGPDAFARYMTETAPAGMPMTDQWRHAEDLLSKAFLQKGDIEGAQHARDYVLQMSHTGTNQYLMAAHQALSNGQGQAAAQYLAKAHAFFPDGTVGRFHTDGKNVYADQLDENDPTRKAGPSSLVTPQAIESLLNQTTDPAKFVKTLHEQQAANADARLKQLHGDYYRDYQQTRKDVNASTVAGRQSVADTHAAATVDAARIRAGIDHNTALSRQVDKETTETYSPDLNATNKGLSPAALANMADVHKDARTFGQSTPMQAERISRGLSDNTLRLLRGADGNYGVVDPTSKNSQPIGYLSKAMGDRLLGGAAAQPQAIPASPVGAGAATPFAAGSGVNSNLTGTVTPQPQQRVPVAQSSAMPVGAP